MTSLFKNLVALNPLRLNGSAQYGLPIPLSESSPGDLYRLLRAYYENNGLFDVLTTILRDAGTPSEQLKGLRNPAFRVVEFHAAHLWPGTLPEALPIVAENAKLEPAITQVWEWSNWGAKKQVAARWLAIYGDLFIKVVQREDKSRVYFQLLDPAHVADFDTDERGFLTYCRIDVPVTEREGDSGRFKRLTNTEVWEKDRLRVWRHERGDAPIGQLGTPVRDDPLSTMGIDFVPIAHAKFRDIGDARGVGAFTLQLDKIDEANRQATRLYSLLFRHNSVTWALRANGMDASGRPLPAPRLSTDSGPVASDGTLRLGDDTLLRLPGNSDITSLVPLLPYDAALAILQDYLRELEQDLPELAYARVREMGDVSGRAVRLLLSDALSRVLEARGNAESALIRANQMALTLGAHAGLFGELGTFEAGDFVHSFEPRDVLPADELERSTTEQAFAQAAATWVTAGLPLAEWLRRERGWSDDDLKALGQARLEEIQRQQMLALDDLPEGDVAAVQ